MPRASLITLGCARNETDSEELAARLERAGWEVGADDDGASADVVLVNTCGFVAAAKKDSVDALLAAADGSAPVVAVGCLAERYGAQLAAELPEAAAVLSFDDYADIGTTLERVLAGDAVGGHAPRDRRTLLPLAPTARPAALAGTAVPGLAQRRPGSIAAPDRGDLAVPVPGGSRVLRSRLSAGVAAPLRIASGCDRRCAFCAIPSFRGSFVSRDPGEVVEEAGWLADRGVRELVLVSENSTSYGKDLGRPDALAALLPRLAAVPGVVRVRVVYLQPAEVRPALVEVLTGTPGVAAYADLSFQHASEPVLRRMRRFGSTERFTALLGDLRARSPRLGARTNVIVGFPGETAADLTELERFLTVARLDAVGVFGYSDEDGTEAAGLDAQVRPGIVTRRERRVRALAEELTAQRAEDRLGEVVEVLVEAVAGAGGWTGPGSAGWTAEGCAEHQQPEVDGSCRLVAGALSAPPRVGDLVRARVTGTEGVDLLCVAEAVVSAAAPSVAA